MYIYIYIYFICAGLLSIPCISQILLVNMGLCVNFALENKIIHAGYLCKLGQIKFVPGQMTCPNSV